MDLGATIFMKRMSKRAYLAKPIPPDVLERICERVRWSPSSGNSQSWRMILVSEPSQHAAVMTAMERGNQWAAAAPTIVIVCAREKDDWTRPDNGLKYAHFDSGVATMALLLGAVEEGLLAHPTAGWDAIKMKEIIGAPDDADVLCVVALGYQGAIESLDEHTRKKDEAVRTRKPVEATIAHDRWNFA